MFSHASPTPLHPSLGRYDEEVTGSRLVLDAIGVSVGVTLDDSLTSREQQALCEIWSGAVREGSADVEISAGVVRESGGAGPLPDVFASDFRDLASKLSSRVTLAAIESQRGRLLMLHACGVASPDGTVVAFVGPSGRGKTTLASSVARAWSYISDETVGIAAAGVVHPYRKPLSVIVADSDTKSQVSPDDLGLLPLPDAMLEIGAIVLLDRQPDGPDEPRLSPVRLVDALVELIPEMSYLPLLERPLQTIATIVDRVGGVRRLNYREAGTVPPLLESLIVEDPADESASGWAVIPFHSLEQPNDRRGAVGTVYRRRVPLDAIASDGAYVLLHDNQVRVLDGIGPFIWDALATGRSLPSIVDYVVEHVGSPASGDATELVSAAVGQLLEAEVLLKE
jgi:energy-coupling factor transporter ATP-binding protein EcfA2